MVYNPAAGAFSHSKFLRHEKSVEIEFMDNEKTKFGKNSSTDCLISALIASNDKPSIGSKINS